MCLVAKPTRVATAPKAGDLVARWARVVLRAGAELTVNAREVRLVRDADTGDLVPAVTLVERVTVTVLPSPGRYAVEWFGHARREVYLSDLPRGRHVCPCPGHCYRDDCRHVRLLLALQARGELA